MNVDNVVVGYTKHYVHFMNGGKLSSVIAEQESYAAKHVHRLSIFLKKYVSIPYQLKRKMLDAAFMSAIMCAAESWVTDILYSN